MTPLPSPRYQPGKLPLFALIVVVVCQPCIAQPRPTQTDPRAPTAGTKRQPVAAPKTPPSQFRRPKFSRPDPRYRPPANLAELQAVAGEVARTSGRVIHWRLALGENPGPLARIRGGLDDCTILLHPVAAKNVPPNTWAFIIGHEFAHRVENLGNHSQSNPANELKADIAGARYAMAAGYRLEAFLGWVLAEPNHKSNSHGSLHKRVQAIAAHFGIRQKVLQAEAQRYAKYRAPR